MLDLKFDIMTREVVMQDNDFALTENPSVQNGGIAEYSRVAHIQTPMFGVGVEEYMNAGMTKVAYEMNRWKSMVLSDGATIARWTSMPMPGNNVAVGTEISYL